MSARGASHQSGTDGKSRKTQPCFSHYFPLFCFMQDRGQGKYILLPPLPSIRFYTLQVDFQEIMNSTCGYRLMITTKIIPSNPVLILFILFSFDEAITKTISS